MLAATQLQPFAAPGDVDLSFDAGSTVNGAVNAMALQADGKVLIGGDFTTVHGMMRGVLARLKEDGSTDPTFLSGLEGITNANNGGSGWVRRIAIQPDAKILIAGYFSSVNGSPHNCIARLNPDGTVDNSFAANLGGGGPWASSLALQGDGKILVAGEFTAVNGSPRNGLARLNPDGSLDSSFIGTSAAIIESMALQSDGKIVLGGYQGLARLNPDGSPDPSFVGLPNPQGRVFTLALQPDGKILFSGENFPFGVFCFARANSDGSLDTSFPVTDVGWVNVILPQSDGKILLGGPFTSIGGIPRTIVVRLNADGSLDPSFLDGLQSPWGGDVRSLVLRADGKILVGGNFELLRGSSLVRLNADGSFDPAFGNGPAGLQGGSVRAIVVQPDGKPIVGGTFSTIDGTGRGKLARLKNDGSLDTSFSAQSVGGWGGVLCLALQPDGRILVGGDYRSLLRLNPDGSPDSSFATDLAGADTAICALALQPDGQVLIGGWFSLVNGGASEAVARLNPNGSLDTGFASRIQPPGSCVRAIAREDDGKIFIGGDFASVNGLSRPHLARLNRDGSPDTFSADLDGDVTGFCPLPNGQVLIWGGFTFVNGADQAHFVRLNADGSLDPTFVGGRNGDDTYTPNAVALQPDGKLLVAREVWSGSSRPYFVRLTANGSFDDSFFAGQCGPDNDVDSLAVRPDGKILLGGLFSVVNQAPCSGVIRLTGDSAPPAILVSPGPQTTEEGSAVGLRVKASSSLPLFYFWYLNSTNLTSCSTNWGLKLTNVQFSQSGAYTVVVSNALGAVTSAPAMLNVIAAVERRPVPGVKVTGESASLLNVDYANSLSPAPNWTTLGSVSLATSPQYYFDLTLPLPPQRFYRAWQTGTPGVMPSLDLNLVPAITLAGNIGHSVRLDYINQFGPTDAWATLATVTLTNTSQLYFDVSAPGQPSRLYRLVMP